jgi:hypothetical protein
MTHTLNREGWLTEVAKLVEPVILDTGIVDDLPGYRVACGFPSKHATARSRRRVGECWRGEASTDGRFEVFVSPLIADPVEVAGILVHELAHVADRNENGHKGRFVRLARALALEGKPTATTVGDRFRDMFRETIEAVGDYPHAAMVVAANQKKQSTRLLKVECLDCLNEGDPYIVRMSRTAIEKGLPICPLHGLPMEAV